MLTTVEILSRLVALRKTVTIMIYTSEWREANDAVQVKFEYQDGDGTKIVIERSGPDFPTTLQNAWEKLSMVTSYGVSTSALELPVEAKAIEALEPPVVVPSQAYSSCRFCGTTDGNHTASCPNHDEIPF